MDEKQARTELTEVCRLAYERGYICGVEGNFSVRLGEDLVLSTPSGICKGRIEPADFILTGLDGKLTEGAECPGRKPSTELAMHLTAYSVRPDVRAVVHTHPPVAVGFTVAGLALTDPVLPEVVCSLGAVPTAPYATPSTGEVSASIRELVKQYDAVLLDHHGALTLGTTIWDAFYKLETVEHFAQTMLVAHALGGPKPLSAEQIRKLLEIRSVYGFARPLPAELVKAAGTVLPEGGIEN